MSSSRLGLAFVVSLAAGSLLIPGALQGQANQPNPPPAEQNQNPYPPGPPPQDPYRGYGSDYPAVEVQAVPIARAQSVRARLERDLIQTNLHRWIDRSWDDFLHSKEYQELAATEKRALEAYHKERDRVLKSLADDSNYQTLKSMIGDLSQKLDDERYSTDRISSADAIENMMAIATVKLGYAATASAMETAAMNADGAVQDARNKLIEASAKARDSRKGFDRQVRRDPEFLARRGRMEEANIDYVVASAFLESAIIARTIALDYAYYVHWWDQYKYSGMSGYGYPYYGNGYGYPYYTTGYTYYGSYMRRY